MKVELASKVAGVVAVLGFQWGCGEAASTTPPDVSGTETEPADVRPLLFFTANGDGSRLSLRSARTDGSAALLATREAPSPRVSQPLESFRYTGNRDRRGTFPSMSPYWLNASASPDGAWVLWKREDSSWDLMDARGEALVLPGMRWQDSPATLQWAPDGSRFVGLDPDTCTLQAVTPGEALVVGLAQFGDDCARQEFSVEVYFSPDGTSLAYWSHLAAAPAPIRTGELHIVDLDGTGDRVISPRASLCRSRSVDGYYEKAPWSPDGTWLAFASTASEAAATLQFQTSKADGSVAFVGVEVPLSDVSQTYQQVVCDWSPRGDRVAAGTAKGLYSFPAKSDASAVLVTGPTWEEYAWSGDGRWLSFRDVTDTRRSLRVARADGSETRTLAEPGADEFLMQHGWSGSAVLYTRTPTATPNASRVHVLDLESGREWSDPDPSGFQSWMPGGDRLVYETPSSCWSSDPRCGVVSVRADGSGRREFEIPGMSSAELIWLAGGKVMAGADDQGLWLQGFDTAKRTAVWENDASEYFLDFAVWDYPRVWH